MSPETIARSVQRLNAAGVGWPTTRRVAITVRLAGLADVIALGDGVVGGPTAARAAVGHVLRVAGRETDPAAALREISKVQRVLSVMGPTEPERTAVERGPRAVPGPLVEPDPPARPDRPAGPGGADVGTGSASDRPTTGRPPTGRPAPGRSTAAPRPLPVRPVRPVSDGPT